MQTAHHTDSTFLVPMRDQSPDVGFWPQPVEPIQNEVAELAARHCRTFPTDQTLTFRALVAFGLALIALLKARATQDIDDEILPTIRPVTGDAAQIQKIVAARLGRLLDWICRGRRVLDMGPRAFAVASHIRASAVDHRTDQAAAVEIGNGARQSIAKIRSEFRRDLGADYPGENGETSDTKRKCKNSRNTKLQGNK
jgi:hypothetical protein